MTKPSTPLSGLKFVDTMGTITHLASRFLQDLWDRGSTKQLSFSTVTLTDAATISWDLDFAQVARITLGGNRTMAAPTNMVDGGEYTLFVVQDGTGSRTITWNAVFKWPGGSAPILSTGVGAVDIIRFTSNGSSMYGKADLNFS